MVWQDEFEAAEVGVYYKYFTKLYGHLLKFSCQKFSCHVYCPSTLVLKVGRISELN